MSITGGFFGGAAASGAVRAAREGRDPIVGAAEGVDDAARILAPFGYFLMWMLAAGFVNSWLIDTFGMPSQNMAVFSLAAVLVILPVVALRLVYLGLVRR